MWKTDYENLLNALRNVGFIIDEYGLKPELRENSGKSIHNKLRVKKKNLLIVERLIQSHKTDGRTWPPQKALFRSL
jgi:hypothetical protein